MANSPGAAMTAFRAAPHASPAQDGHIAENAVERLDVDPAARRYLDDRRRAENFPVALRILPRPTRADLRAIYDVVRTIDDLGDEPMPADIAAAASDPAASDPAASDRAASGLAASGPAVSRLAAARLAALDEFAADVDRAWSGRRPNAAVLRRLAPVIERRSLDRADIVDLIEANRMDQRIVEHPDMKSLEAYCRLSAAPIGRLVLAVFDGPRDAATLRRSDQVCTALQIIEHLQDVGEDRRRGRIYLPADVRRQHGVLAQDLDGTSASMQLRAAIRFAAAGESMRLRQAAPLLGSLHGWTRVAVAGYAAGGFAALDGIRRTAGDVLGGDPSARRRDVARHAARLLAGRGRP